MEKGKNMPEKKIRAGAVTATIWRNEVTSNTTGEPGHYHSVALDRNYKDKNGEWKSTNSFRAMDLPKAVLVLNKAFEYLMLENQSESSVKSSSSGSSSKMDNSIEIEDIDLIM